MSSARQVALCMGRAVQRIQNEIGPTLGAIIANMVLGLVVGSAFYNLPNTTDSFQQRAVVIFFSLIVNSFSPAYEVCAHQLHRHGLKILADGLTDVSRLR